MLGLDGAPIDLAFVFVSPHHAESIDQVAIPLAASIGGGTLLGATTEAPIAQGREVESGPAIAVWLASMNVAKIRSFRVDLQETPDGQALVGFPLIGDSVSAAFLLTDPFSFPTNSLLASLNGDHPGLPIIGGAASGGQTPGENLLILNGEIFGTGAVGTILGPEIDVSPILSQGCKPIGDPFVVTNANQNMILELGGKPPLHRLREVVSRLDSDDQALVATGLHVGILIDEQTEELNPGDFLIRGIIHANLRSGAMALSDAADIGQTLQFQLRDGAAAHGDLSRALTSGIADQGTQPSGALLFTCNGRGSRLFGTPDHDVQELERFAGQGTVAGMFCQGEIGPVGGRNFLHGFTASIAVFN
ncbi:MAG TPA: FIST N-terminal domain-containing protein [Actinomycetota bacterium]|nr:FIST N-terminal domain-containing protein [Actinomycetota bacterium]